MVYEGIWNYWWLCKFISVYRYSLNIIKHSHNVLFCFFLFLPVHSLSFWYFASVSFWQFHFIILDLSTLCIFDLSHFVWFGDKNGVANCILVAFSFKFLEEIFTHCLIKSQFTDVSSKNLLIVKLTLVCFMNDTYHQAIKLTFPTIGKTVGQTWWAASLRERQFSI